MEDELQAIKQLMDELQGEMKYGKDDFEERLGRKKPDAVEVIKVEGDPADEDMADEGMDDEGRSPEDELKDRLMRLRG